MSINKKYRKLKVDWHKLAINLRAIKPLSQLSKEHGYYHKFLDRFANFEAIQPNFEDGMYWLDVHYDLLGEEATKELNMHSNFYRVMQDSGLVTYTYLAKKYGIDKKFMLGVILHEENHFPECKKIVQAGRSRLYDEDEVDAWLGGREIKAIPRVEALAYVRYKKGSEKRNYSVDFIGVGGKAVGETYQSTADFYRRISRVRKAA